MLPTSEIFNFRGLPCLLVKKFVLRISSLEYQDNGIRLVAYKHTFRSKFGQNLDYYSDSLILDLHTAAECRDA